MKAFAFLAGIAAASAMLPPTAFAQLKPVAAECVNFGKPRPTTTYVYRRSEPNGKSSQYSHRWTEFTAERAGVSVARGSVNEVVANRHKIEDDVTMIAATASRTSNGSSRTDFRPAVMGEPMFRACAGRSWKIRAVAATYTAGAQVTTAQTYPGTMNIVSLREAIQLPAGRFECVRYTRTLSTPSGPSHDEYWKSIEHGVVVKQVSKVAGWTSTSELVAIK
ncbi:MAG: hypothetical protein ACT4UQ_06075 [Gammaproteobacteria bacterium]